MSTVGQIERKTQARVVTLFREQLVVDKLLTGFDAPPAPSDWP